MGKITLSRRYFIKKTKMSSFGMNKSNTSVAKQCCSSGNNFSTTSLIPSGANRCTVYCFTPRNASGTVSLVSNTDSARRQITIDQNLVVIPANSIIDRVEFFGVSGFSTKGSFSIGLGQLNGSIMTSLVENTTASIANEKVGGCREFLSISPDGKNLKTMVLLQSNVNVILENPVTSGNLLVVIDYHIKPSHV